MITPQQARAARIPSRQRQDALEATIDEAILKMNGGGTVTVDDRIFLSPFERDFMLHAYRSAGWLAEWTFDQRDGGFVTIREKGE